jgi:two-component system phosphate regulon sensor histidine kinase PhoR
VLLFSAQFFLIYNTYKLKNDQYFTVESGLINREYYASIHNDKLYPGAQAIVDTVLMPEMTTLERLYNAKSDSFDILTDYLCREIFTRLKSSSVMDSLFGDIVSRNHLSSDLEYLLVINRLSVSFKNNEYIPIYKAGQKVSYAGPASQIPDGLIIAGDLKTPNNLNRISALDVSAPYDYSNQMSFSLYVDSSHRVLAVIRQMWPTLLLAFFSIILMFGINYYTFRNWRKQKKLAEMKADFVNSITHEFNTPLSTIIIANRNVQDEEIIYDATQVRLLTRIIGRQAQRLKVLFGRVLDITTMNVATLDKKEYELSELMEEILLDYRLNTLEREVSITLNKHELTTKVLLDRFWFTTMLINIFENAIKYNNQDTKKIDVSLNKREEGQLEISIRDNGIGMPKQVLGQIFEKFFRKKSESTKEVNGLGLGLFYTMQGIKAHGWEIQVKSEENVGSNFIIIIPKS